MLGQTSAGNLSVRWQKKAVRFQDRSTEAGKLSQFYGLHKDLLVFNTTTGIDSDATRLEKAKILEARYPDPSDLIDSADKRRHKLNKFAVNSLAAGIGAFFAFGLVGVVDAIITYSYILEKASESANVVLIAAIGSAGAGVLGGLTFACLSVIKSKPVKFARETWKTVQGIIKAAEPKEQPESRVAEPVV